MGVYVFFFFCEKRLWVFNLSLDSLKCFFYEKILLKGEEKVVGCGFEKREVK